MPEVCEATFNVSTTGVSRLMLLLIALIVGH
jgi:hypothetical protein